MEYNRLKLIWDTNRTGTLFLAVAGLFQVWVSFCDKSSFTWQILDSGRHRTELFWNWIWVGLFKENEFLIHTLGTGAWTILIYTLLNSLFLFADVTGYPRWLYKYKIQVKPKNNPVDLNKIPMVLKVTMFNVAVVNPFFNVITYPVNIRFGIMSPTGPLPSLGGLALLFFAFRILEEFGNYYGHRLLHLPQFYKYHKQHHEWTAPIAIVTTYAHPLEHFFANILPVAAGPFLFRCHMFVAWIWAALVILTATLEHAGYHLPFMYSAEGHDYHHRTFNCWYGTMAFLDVLHGTDRPFSDTIHGKRQYISCTLTPIKEIVREEKER